MAGVSGKNAELRISTAETPVATVDFDPHPNATLAALGVFSPPSGDKNWKYAAPGEADTPLITYIAGSPPVEKQIDSNSRFIHYAGGAVRIPPEDYPTLVAASVSGSYTKMEMDQVGNIATNERSAEANTEAPIIDTTTIGEEFQTFTEGIPGFSGTLTGLYVNAARFKLAIANASGIIPRKVLRIKPRKDKPTTYFQGTVIFPNFDLSLAFDSAIERGVEFTGIGPFELIEDGLPWFPGT